MNIDAVVAFVKLSALLPHFALISASASKYYFSFLPSSRESSLRSKTPATGRRVWMDVVVLMVLRIFVVFLYKCTFV